MTTYAEMQAGLDAEAEARKKAAMAFIADANKKTILAEYAAQGIAPVYADDGETLCSLPMMLHMGWRIEHVDGRPALTRGGAA